LEGAECAADPRVEGVAKVAEGGNSEAAKIILELVGIGFGHRETSEEMDTLNILTLSTDFCAQNCFMLRWIVQAFLQLWVPCNLFSRQLTHDIIVFSRHSM
jgi:hypothetical protein